MRWDDFRRSDNVEDAGSGGGGMPFGGGFRLGGGAIIAVVVISLLLGKNPLDVLTLLESGSPPAVQSQSVSPGNAPGASAQNDPQRDFVRAILGDTEDFWTEELARHGVRYQRPKLELFDGQVGSACGVASAAMGPFYCPGDQRVYLDLSFFRDLSQRFGAPGDFARAYVIAHEIGHHVQNQLGLMGDRQDFSGGSDRSRNAQSVRIELQADCLAGVWGHSAQQRGAIDTRDIEQGLAAAASVGDDRLQQQARGYAVPESFTHGSSEQRVRWFRTGLTTGDLRQCDTFSAAKL